MFENSFVTRLNLRCPIHTNNKISYVCPKPTCQKNPLLCDQCMNSKMKDQHYGHEFDLQKVDKYLQKICQTIKYQKKNVQKLYKTILQQKQNQNLLKWQQQKQQHFQSIQNHLNTLKFQIDEEIRNILQKFQYSLNHEKQNIYHELESYFQTYKNKFVHFAQLTEPVVMMHQMYSYYQSKNTLSLKLMSLDSNNLSKWVNNLKFYLNRAQLATRKQVQYTNKVQQLSIVTNELMDELPRLRNVDFDNQLPDILKQSSKNVLKSLVSLRRMKSSQNHNSSFSSGNANNHPMRSTSMNFISTDHIRTNSSNRTGNDVSRQRNYYPDK